MKVRLQRREREREREREEQPPPQQQQQQRTRNKLVSSIHKQKKEEIRLYCMDYFDRNFFRRISYLLIRLNFDQDPQLTL